jgi:ethanolamine permease
LAEKRHEGGVSYRIPGKDYFEKRELRRYAGLFSLWALGVAAVISGEFSGWNLGFNVGGWGGMFIGAIIITIMYLGLTYSIAEMSPALPHTGGAYSFARTAFGPWGGFITGVSQNIEFVLTPAVIVFFIGSYLTAIFDTPTAFQPIWWILGYIIFVGPTLVGSSCRSLSPLLLRFWQSRSSSSFFSQRFQSLTSASMR